MRSQVVENQHYDEALSLESSSEGAGYGGGDTGNVGAGYEREEGHGATGIVTGSVLGPHMGGRTEGGAGGALGMTRGLAGTAGNLDEAASGAHRVDGPAKYDASQYDDLQVSAEIRDLFGYIERYMPTSFDIETSLKPFIPEYIPSIGDIDGFLKVPRPDGKDDGLALAVVDEPCTKQSDPTVLTLQLRANSRKSNLTPMAVKAVDPVAEPKAIASWIENISEMHSRKPLPSVSYSRPMPDIEALMQEWPVEFEEALSKAGALPTAELDVDLATYARIVCAILDIPVHDSVVESLHVLFTLYREAKSHQGVNAFD